MGSRAFALTCCKQLEKCPITLRNTVTDITAKNSSPPFPFPVVNAIKLINWAGCTLQWFQQKSSTWLQEVLLDGKQKEVWNSADGTDEHCASQGVLPGAPTRSLAAFVIELGMRGVFVLLSFFFPLYVILLLATRQQQCSSLECERFSNKRSPWNTTQKTKTASPPPRKCSTLNKTKKKRRNLLFFCNNWPAPTCNLLASCDCW